MKLKDVVHFGQLRPATEKKDGPVVVKEPKTAARIDELIAAVNHEPGLSAGQLADRVGFVYLNEQQWAQARVRVSGTLTSHLRSKTPDIKRVKQDGLWRYYPANYKLTTDKTIPAPAPAQKLTKFPTSKEVLAALAEHPGLTAKELGFAMGLTHAAERNRVGKHLGNNSRLPTSPVRAEGTPKKYWLRDQHVSSPDGPKPEPVVTSKFAAVPHVSDDFATKFESVLKDYVWATGAPSEPLRDLLKWHKEQANDHPHTK